MKWANEKQNNFNIYNIVFFFLKYKEKHLQISLSKSWWHDLQFLRYRAKNTEIGNFRSFFCPFTHLKTPNIKILKCEKICWRYHHMFTKNQNHMMYVVWMMLYEWWQIYQLLYDVWFLRYRVRQTEFFAILGHFLPFYHLPPPP